MKYKVLKDFPTADGVLYKEEIVKQWDAFKTSKMDEDVKTLLLSKKFTDKLDGSSIESVLTDSSFISELNLKGNKSYTKSNVYVKEALEEATS